MSMFFVVLYTKILRLKYNLTSGTPAIVLQSNTIDCGYVTGQDGNL
jgi:hypothetical protein